MNISEFISSGIIESYVLGIASFEEIKNIHKIEKLYPEIINEINEVEYTLLKYGEINALYLHPLLHKV